MLLVSLLATVALVFIQNDTAAGAQIQTKNANFDNNVLSNVIPSSHRRRRQMLFVKVTHPPPETLRHEPGVNLELTCGVMGSPTPQIQWLRNGEPFEHMTPELKDVPLIPLSIATVMSTLIISEPSPNPEDVYTCVGIAGSKKTQASTTVFTDTENAEDFLQQFLALPSKPRITYYYKAILVRDYGTDVVLPCWVTSDMEVQLYWTDNKDQIVREGSKAKILPSGHLLIPDVQWSDMGDWNCVVKNHLGEDSQSTFFYPAPLG